MAGKITAAAAKLIAARKASLANRNDCANCGKPVTSRNKKVNTCSKTCEGALLHKIMNGHV